MPYTVFEYLYRDASNYKAHGRVWIDGNLSPAKRAEIVDCLEAQEFFVAQQAGLPSLEHLLYAYSDGPTDDDHGWHTFVSFRTEDVMTADCQSVMDNAAFVSAFVSNRGKWDVGYATEVNPAPTNA